MIDIDVPGCDPGQLSPELIERARELIDSGLPIDPESTDPVTRLAWAALVADQREAMADVHQHNQQTRAGRHQGGWRVSPSDYGRCPRAIWYRETPPAGYVPLPDTDIRPAAAGTAMHAGITQARAVLYPWRRHQVPVRVPGLDWTGEADEYDPVTATLEDWKTAGEVAWDMVGADGPFASAIGQAHIYAYGLIAAGHPVRTVRLRYVRRANGEDEVFDYPYDHQRALDAVSSLIEVLTHLDLGATPPRTGAGPTTDRLCQRCPARAHCWPMEYAATLGRTPESVDRFPAPDPADPDLLWAIEQAGLLRRARLDAEKAEKAAAALVDVPAGEYGDWKVVSRTVRRPDYHGAYDTLVDRLHYYADLPPGQVDLRTLAPGDVPRTRTVSSFVEPVRAAKKAKRAQKGGQR